MTGKNAHLQAIARWNHPLVAYFRMSLCTTSHADPAYREHQLAIRRLELEMDPSVRIAEAEAKQMEARAAEAVAQLALFRLRLENQMMASKARDHYPTISPPLPPRSPVKSTKVTQSHSAVKPISRPSDPFIHQPRAKRLAATFATEDIIKIQNQDRKAHTKTSLKETSREQRRILRAALARTALH